MARARPEPDHEYRPIKRFTPGNGRMVNWADRNEPASMRHDRVYAPIAEARSAVDAAHARCQELQRRNDALIVRRREASERGDRMQSRRLAPEHRHIVSELRRAAHDWNLAVNRLLDAELDERGY